VLCQDEMFGTDSVTTWNCNALSVGLATSVPA